jgi:hypothetical protein
VRVEVCHGSGVDCYKKEQLFSNKYSFGHEHGVKADAGASQGAKRRRASGQVR